MRLHHLHLQWISIYHHTSSTDWTFTLHIPLLSSYFSYPMADFPFDFYRSLSSNLSGSQQAMANTSDLVWQNASLAWLHYMAPLGKSFFRGLLGNCRLSASPSHLLLVGRATWMSNLRPRIFQAHHHIAPTGSYQFASFQRIKYFRIQQTFVFKICATACSHVRLWLLNSCQRKQKRLAKYAKPANPWPTSLIFYVTNFC